MIVSLASWLIIERKESILRSVVVYLCTKISGAEVIIIAKPWKRAKINIPTIKIYHNLFPPHEKCSIIDPENIHLIEKSQKIRFIFDSLDTWVVRPAGLSIGIRSRREPKRRTQEKISFTGAARTLFNALYYREPIYELLIRKQQLSERWFIAKGSHCADFQSHKWFNDNPWKLSNLMLQWTAIMGVDLFWLPISTDWPFISNVHSQLIMFEHNSVFSAQNVSERFQSRDVALGTDSTVR